MRFPWGLAALSSLVLGVAAQGEPLNFTVNAVEESNYLAATCTTALCTVFITEIRHTTIISTVTEFEGTTTTTKTDLVLTTEWTTTTTTKTFETSYPYTTTTIVHCPQPTPTDDPYPTDDYPTDPSPTYRRRTPEHETPICFTETVTEWKTETTTTVTTEWVPTTIPVTIPTTVPITIPITVPITIVTTRSTTIWKPTTYTTEISVTVTSGTTYTSISSTTSTVTTTVPVISYETDTVTKTITGPGQTITAPGETITAPGETVTAPGETITLPGEVTTLPATTIIATIIVEGPEVTTTVTEDGETVTTTLPGTTSVTTATQIIPPSTVTAPGTTITVSALVDVTLCPTPTGNSRPYNRESDETFGCSPGFVCNAPKPDDCNFWPDPPINEFVCEPQDCISAPPFRNVSWDEGQTSYYPPRFGYFDLNPEAFGLSYDIFEYHVKEEVIDGQTVTITTGNWESQATLSDWPRATSSASAASSEVDPYTDRLRKRLMKRAATPAVCYGTCNDAYSVAQFIGKTDALCAETGQFRMAYDVCVDCIQTHLNTTRLTIRDYVGPRFFQYLDWCEPTDPDEVEGPGATGPETAVSTDPVVSTSSQDSASSETFIPVNPSSNSTETSTPLSSSGTPSATPTITGTPSSPVETPIGSTSTIAVVPEPTGTGSFPTTSVVVVPPGNAASRISSSGFYLTIAATLTSLLFGMFLI